MRENCEILVKTILYENGSIILCVIYQQMANDIDNGVTNWENKVKRLLNSSGCPEVWMFPGSVYSETFIPVLRKRLIDIHISRHVPYFNSLFRRFKRAYKLAPYLT